MAKTIDIGQVFPDLNKHHCSVCGQYFMSAFHQTRHTCPGKVWVCPVCGGPTPVSRVKIACTDCYMKAARG